MSDHEVPDPAVAAGASETDDIGAVLREFGERRHHTGYHTDSAAHCCYCHNHQPCAVLAMAAEIARLRATPAAPVGAPSEAQIAQAWERWFRDLREKFKLRDQVGFADRKYWHGYAAALDDAERFAHTLAASLPPIEGAGDRDADLFRKGWEAGHVAGGEAVREPFGDTDPTTERALEVLEKVDELLAAHSVEDAMSIVREERSIDEANHALLAVEFWDAVLTELLDRG